MYVDVLGTGEVSSLVSRLEHGIWGGLFIEVPGFLIAAVSLFPPGERVSHCATCILLLFRCIDSCL